MIHIPKKQLSGFDMTREEASDRTLLRRFRDGQQDAASELYLRYAKRLQSIAHRRTAVGLSVRKGADDIVQSVFRTFFRRVSEGQYDVADGEDLWRLFLVIALNKIRSAAEFHYAQKRDVRKTHAVDPTVAEALAKTGEDDQLALTVLRMTVDEVLESLPEPNRKLVRLRIEGHSVEQISEATGRARRTIERVLQTFRQLLVEQIEAADES